MVVWERARLLTGAIYRTTDGFPRREQFGLAEQMRRAAVSVPSNIAEGSGRGSDAEYSRFVGYAAASLNELECQLVISGDLGFIAGEALGPLLAETERLRAMLSGLRKALRPRKPK